jgi:predicted ATPase
VAAVLGITQQPGKSVAESVAAALEGRVRLLVFDNCEHVRDAAASVSHAQRGSIVELQLTDGGRGLLVGIGGADSGFPFCKMVNGGAANPMDCGA